MTYLIKTELINKRLNFFGIISEILYKRVITIDFLVCITMTMYLLHKIKHLFDYIRVIYFQKELMKHFDSFNPIVNILYKGYAIRCETLNFYIGISLIERNEVAEAN